MSEPGQPGLSRMDRLRCAVEHGAHLLSRQGPIGVFVHHNTLHAFEHLPFEEAVKQAGQLFGAEPYMSEASYRAELARGRIQLVDVDAVLDREPDFLIFARLSRSSLRRAMITPGVREFDGATIVWRIEQGDLAKDFRRAALRVLFEACFARTVAHEEEPVPPRPVDEVIHPWLIRLCSVFLDQGTAYWPMPNREKGFYESVRMLLSRRGGILPKYLVGLDEEFRRQEHLSFSAADAVLDYLDSRSLGETEWPGILQAELLALPGWAGLMHKLEEDPTLAPHKILPCSLMDFLAVRLTMSRVAARRGAEEPIPEEPPLKTQERRRLSRTARVYDAARVLRLSAEEVESLSESEWVRFSSEVKAFNGLERRRILHLAYERAHEREILRGLASHRKYRGLFDQPQRPPAQVFFCLDEREESMRRALEEAHPSVETYSAAGYFGVAVDYKGIDDPHGAALCPVVVKPEHAVMERPKPGDSQLLESRRWRRRVLGLLMRNSFVSSKTLLRGWVSTSALGLLSAVPLIGQSPGAATLCTRARLAERGISTRTADRTHLDAKHKAISRCSIRSVDGVHCGRKGRTSRERPGSGWPGARFRSAGCNSGPRLVQPQQSARVGPRLRRLRGVARRAERTAFCCNGQPAGSTRTLAAERDRYSAGYLVHRRLSRYL